MAGKKLKVTLIRSKSGQTERQVKTVHGLGLNKVNSSRVLNDTPAVRGLINKVAHLVTVESAVKG